MDNNISFYDDIFDENINKPFLGGYKLLKIPIEKEGKPTWPEKFPRKKIKELKLKAGRRKFASQMLLEPLSIKKQFFNISLLNVYDHPLDITESNKQTIFSINNTPIKYVNSYWDPSFGSAKGDASVIVCLYIDYNGHFYIHDIEYIKADKDNKEQHKPAISQCKTIISFIKKNYINQISIETNGIGKFLPDLLKDELIKENLNIKVLEKHSKSVKELRIIDTIEPPLEAGFLNISQKVYNSFLIKEFSDFNPNNKNNIDDGLDALSGALLQTPSKIKDILNTSSKKHIIKNYKTYIAKNDFKI